MAKTMSRNDVRKKRHARVRNKISGTPECPRLNMKLANGGNVEAAAQVGKAVAERALEKKIENVVFDRGGYIYHGRVKALAEAAREAGLKF